MPHQRQFDEAASIIIRVRVTPTQRHDLEDVARQNGTTISGAMRDAVDGYVSDFRDDAPVFGGNRRTLPDS